MRTSKDIYKLPNGDTVAVSQMEQPPQGATLWRGYDYDKQEWIFNGERDTRFDHLSNGVQGGISHARKHGGVFITR